MRVPLRPPNPSSQKKFWELLGIWEDPTIEPPGFFSALCKGVVVSQALENSFLPVLGERPVGLILGTAPSRKSLEHQEYYAFPRNRFWVVWGELLGFSRDLDYASRLERLNEAGLGLWDVVGRFRRDGSLDSGFREVSCNDFKALFQEHPQLRRVAFNGKKAHQFFLKQMDSHIHRVDLELTVLPSTSPANARFTYPELLKSWGEWFRSLPPPARRSALRVGSC